MNTLYIMCVSRALPVVTLVIVPIVSIFIANQFRVLFILIRLIVQVVDPEDTRVEGHKCGEPALSEH